MLTDFFQTLPSFYHPRIQEWAQIAQPLLTPGANSNLPAYESTLESLRKITLDQKTTTTDIEVRDGAVVVPQFDAESPTRQLLQAFKPWRKGPWQFGPVRIDTEWRSNLKWDRIANHLDLRGTRVLDVGCGSGYHLWRMVQAGAELAVGVEPFLLSVAQFYASWIGIGSDESRARALVVPLTLEQSPDQQWFDVVFSMGVLSHQRSPFNHLAELRKRLVPGGRLVLENLVIEGGLGQVLVPRDRYAKMRNVWFVPSARELQGWLERAGFEEITLVHQGPTTSEEQRRTEWMEFESLENYLDPRDSTKTIEGYPAPRRAVLTAVRTR